MNETKIDWAEMSWNPVTGCRHGCPYCYARRTAHRFDAGLEDKGAVGGLHVLEKKIKATPYPYGFEPMMPWKDVALRMFGDNDERHILAAYRLHGRALVSISGIKRRE